MKDVKFFLSTPISKIEESIPWMVENGFNPEVRMARVDYIMNVDTGKVRDVGDRLKDSGLDVFTHGPFFGLDIASMDLHISEYTLKSLIRGLDMTAALQADIMVMHSGFLPFFSRGGRRHWFSNWAERMKPVLERAGELDITLAIENSWEDRPEVLEHLLELLNSEDVYVCLDTGHLNTFSRLPIDYWWNRLGEKVVAMHLHDNDGLSDDHLPPGRGTFDFQRLGRLLVRMKKLPLLDLEIDRELAEEGREYLRKLWGFIEGGNH